MLDKRKIIRQHEDIGEELIRLTDTEIVLEFSKILTLIYPSLVKLETHCYDEFDDISESLYFNTVFSAFSGKYGAVIVREALNDPDSVDNPLTMVYPNIKLSI